MTVWFFVEAPVQPSERRRPSCSFHSGHWASSRWWW